MNKIYSLLRSTTGIDPISSCTERKLIVIYVLYFFCRNLKIRTIQDRADGFLKELIELHFQMTQKNTVVWAVILRGYLQGRAPHRVLSEVVR